MFRKSRRVSPLLTACVLTLSLSAGFLTDSPAFSVPGAGSSASLQRLSLPLPVMAVACAEGENANEDKGFNNAAEKAWNTATHFITGREVYMRAGPGTDTKAEGFWRFGEPVRILGQEGDWYKAERLLSAGPVYVHKNFVGSRDDVKAKSIPTTSYMLRIDKLYDCLNAAAPFYTKGLDKEAKIKEINYYRDVVTGLLYSIEGSGMPEQTKNDMNRAVLDISDMFDCMKKYLNEQDPVTKEARRDEAYPDLQYYFNEFYVTMDKYR